MDIEKDSEISRYVKPSQHQDGDIDSAVFQLRSGEAALSTNLLDLHEGSEREGRVCDLYKCGYGYPAKKTGGYAVLIYGCMTESFLSDQRVHLNAVHDGWKENPSHCSVYGLDDLDAMIAADLLVECVEEVVLIKNLSL